RCRSGRIARLPESPRLGQGRDTSLIIAEGLSEHFPGVLAEQWRRHRIDGWRQAHVQRRVNIGDGARRRMRNAAETMTVAHFRRVEAFLDGAQIADRYVGLLHLRHPMLTTVAGKDTGNDG